MANSVIVVFREELRQESSSIEWYARSNDGGIEQATSADE